MATGDLHKKFPEHWSSSSRDMLVEYYYYYYYYTEFNVTQI